ncbi:hypothetical protein H0E87_009818 [Populus deltoides]|uniref:Uncharacterized protein n=1 Tax=Populus deltoides TaxID=3696 RepID=A0A8T2YQV6_POPDE|nr:hypothetical protein H0E87_009818 [Populus deltoides]
MRNAKKIGADVVDCLTNFNPHQGLEILILQSPLLTLVSCRPIWEGSQYEGDETKRREALRLAMQLRANYIDVELEIFHEFNDSMDGKKPDKFKVIVSSHNFHNTPTPDAIADLVARIQATGADMVKISTAALDIKDCGKHFSVYGTFSSKAPIIGVVWGERGLISWLLSRKFGSYLTHGAHEAGAISAPGQSTAEDLGRCFL